MEKLPVELTTNILSRLPVKCSARSKCVSRSWQAILSDDPSFPKLQLIQHSKIFFYKHDNCYTVFYIQLPMNDNKNENEPLIIKPIKISDADFVSETLYHRPHSLGAANGFMCMSEINSLAISFLPHNPIYIFNPLTQETAELPHFTLPADWVEPRCVSGFGYNDISDEFMLVLVFTRYKNLIFSAEVQSLTLGCPTWKRRNDIKVPICLHRAYDTVSPPVVKHCLHWITIDQGSSFNGPLIVSYHLSLEIFKYLATPGAHLLLQLPYDCYTLGVLENHLCLAEFSYSCTQIWVMNMYNIKEPWVKEFIIGSDLLHVPELRFSHVRILEKANNGQLLLLCNDKYLVSYDSANGKCKIVEIEGAVKEDEHCLAAHPLVGRCITLKSEFGVDSSLKKITKKE